MADEMTLTSMTPALMIVLKKFYVSRLENALSKMCDDGSFDQKKN